MGKDKTACDPTLLNRFFDEELAPDEHARVTKHLKDCPSCQEALRDYQVISTTLKIGLANEVSRAKIEQVEETVLDLIQRKRVPWWMRPTDLFATWKVYIPVTAMATLLVLFFTLVRHPATVSGRSAIISSFEGDVESVMILETPKSHQTILWFNEATISGDEEGGTQENQSAV